MTEAHSPPLVNVAAVLMVTFTIPADVVPNNIEPLDTFKELVVLLLIIFAASPKVKVFPVLDRKSVV